MITSASTDVLLIFSSNLFHVSSVLSFIFYTVPYRTLPKLDLSAYAAVSTNGNSDNSCFIN